MKWVTASIILLACLAGCHAPKPSFNLLAPYGPPRVPPPQTSLGSRPGPYRPPGNPAAPAGVPGSSVTPTAGQRTDATPAAHTPYMASNQAWTSAQERAAALKGNSAPVTRVEGDVRLASFAAPPTSPASENSQPQQPGNPSLRLGGMPVNDATGITGTAPSAVSPPALFVPEGDATPISHLPPPPPAAMTTNTVVATAQSSDAAQPAANAGKSTLQWKSRQ